MATLTIRNLPPKVVDSLKELARRHGKSMEQEVREVLEAHAANDRTAVLEEIRQSWRRQTRPTTPEEIEEWINTGRE
jgi:plasmid stability protein